VSTHPSVSERLAKLTTDQRAAATAAPGPILCVAPAGSGKTTTLIARIAWLIDTGAAPDAISAITFNTKAARELEGRLDLALDALGVGPGGVRVRTFHALGREILRDAGVDVSGLVDRGETLRSLWPDLTSTELARCDTAFSRLKLEFRATARTIAADAAAGPMARAFVAYETALADRGQLDFDDLIRRALAELEERPALLATWRTRCADLLVDEVQDVDRSQLDLALLLAAPANRIFLVGDDDQSIYGWRLADVRRILTIGERLPGLRRVDLEVNHRCPVPVVVRAVRLIECNEERFAKAIQPRPDAAGSVILAPDASDGPERASRILDSWPADGSTRAFLARTNRELRPAVVAAVRLGIPFRADRVPLLVDEPGLDPLLTRVQSESSDDLPLLVRLGVMRRSLVTGPSRTSTSVSPAPTPEAAPDAELLEALLAWSPAVDTLADLVAAIEALRTRIADLRRGDAILTMATAHSTKGLEFDHVAVLGMEDGRFPSGRSVAEAEDPVRALEEERRLGYVAWTRARRSLTLSYDPAVPSPFLLEAFTPDELGLGVRREPG
jgi:DNA helicase-2/ATP-dependent DNA helicase PcrA